MKKIIAFLMTLTMLLGVASTAISAAAVPEITHGFILGDVDDDAKQSTKDVLLLKKYLSNVAEVKDVNLLAADLDADGNVGNLDLLNLKKVLMGMIDYEGNNTDAVYRLGTLKVDGRNISRYEIVLPEGYVPAMKTAATELQKYVSRAVGITLNITENMSPDSYHIIYGYDEDDEFDLGDEGYHVEVNSDGDVLFTCGKLRGCIYVTYFFLEEIVGYRFLTYDIVYIYEADTVDMSAAFEATEVPSFSYRGISYYSEVISYTDFSMLRLNASDADGSRAGTYDTWGGGVGTVGAHAHSFVSQLGVPNNQQPCMSSNETFEKIVAYNLDLLDTYESRGKTLGVNHTQISCSPNDNTNFCMCESCKQIYDEDESLSGAVFRLSNRVAEKMDEAYPGIQVFTIAYWDARNPPKITKPAHNVCVCFCISGCNNHPYDDVDACIEAGGNERLLITDYVGNTTLQSNAYDIPYLSVWAELTENLYIWYYSVNFSFYMAPSPNLFNIYNDMKYMYDHGVDGVYIEGSGTLSFEPLRAYMLSELAWNADMTEDEFNEMFNEFLMIYYGDGWESIREYIEMANTAGDLQGCWTNNFDRAFNMYNEEYVAANYERFVELFDRAYEMASTEEQKDRVKMTSLHAHYLGLSATFERDYNGGDAETKATYERRYRDFYNTVVEREVEITSHADGDYYDKYGCHNFPSSADDIRNPLTWFQAGYTGRWVKVNGHWQ